MMTTRGQSHSHTNRLSHACWIFNETESVTLVIPQSNESTTLLRTPNVWKVHEGSEATAPERPGGFYSHS
jgi:hypothetical protein